MNTWINKAVSLLTGFAMIFMLTADMSATADSGTITKSYYKYDIETNTRTLYTLSIEPRTFQQPRSSNPIENHVRDGNTGVVYVGGGTGFIIDDHTIATAAHLVNFTLYVNDTALQERFEHSYYFYDTVDIFTYNSSGVPESYTEQLTPVEIHIPVEYLSDAAGSDYALITVEEDLSEYTQFNLAVPYGVNLNLDVFITGIPQDVPAGTNNYDRLMHTGKGKMYTISGTGTLFNHSCGSVGGYSGSPLYIAYQYTANNSLQTAYAAIGIQCGGTQATQMTPYKVQFFKNNPYVSY